MWFLQKSLSIVKMNSKHKKEKRNILALEEVSGYRQIGLRRQFNAKLKRALLSGGSIKRPLPEEFSSKSNQSGGKKIKLTSELESESESELESELESSESSESESESEVNIFDTLEYPSLMGNKEDIIKILEEAKFSLNEYLHRDRDAIHYMPLSWIESKNRQMAFELLPYFKKRGYSIYEDSAVSKELLDAWKKTRGEVRLNDFNVGIEIETCCSSVPDDLDYFHIEGDCSIECENDTEEAVEFILNWDDRKYFQNRENIQNEMETIFNTCKMCANNGSGESTCGVHVHLSHDGLTKKEYPTFAAFFSRYWVSSLYDKLKDKYGLRRNNGFCVENVCYYTDRLEKYRQLNFLPSKESDVWHFEFRGMGDIHTMSVGLVDNFVEELAMGFTYSFQLLLQNNGKLDYKQELWDVLRSEDTQNISTVVEVLRDAKKKGKPIDLDETFFGEDTTILNTILYGTHMTVNDVDTVKEVLDQAHNLDPYYDTSHQNWDSPLAFLHYQDRKLAIALIPYFRQRGYQIGKDKKEYSKEFLNAWEKK